MKKFLILSAVAIITMLSSSVYALQASAEVDLILHNGSRQDPSSYDELNW